jgi:hypothetical protein
MTLTLPQAPERGYDPSNERQTRRSIELAITDLQNALQTIRTSLGAVSIGQGTLTLANGANHNVAAGYSGYVRIDGPSASFSISGLTNGESGRLLVLRNSTVQQMTISNQSASSSAENRIITGTGADLVLTGSTGQVVTLIYDAVDLRWVVFAKHESSDT